MNKTGILQKIYCSVISAMVAISLSWILLLAGNYKLEMRDIALWILLFAVINTIRDVIKNKMITAGIIVYIIAAVTVVGMIEKNIIYSGILMGAFAVYMVSYRLSEREIFRIIAGLLCMLGAFIIFHINGDIPKLLVVMAVILILNACMDCLYIMGVNKSSGKSLIVIYMIIGMILLVTPVKSEPYGWQFICKIADKASEGIVNFLSEIKYYVNDKTDTYEFAYTQYTGNGRVNVGKLIDNNNISLIVSGKKTANNLYLKGNVNQVFDGQQWHTEWQTEDIPVEMYETDTWMTLYACFVLSDDVNDMKEYISHRTQTVVFDNIRTKTTFLPAKLVGMPEETVACGDNVLLGTRKGKRYEYVYNFIDFDYSDARFIDIMRRSQDIEYSKDRWDDMSAYMYNTYNIKPSFEYENFVKHAENLEKLADKLYLDVDNAVSDRTYNLATDIIDNEDNTYDICYKLTEYLKKYKYDKRTYIPEGQNIIDYFLFEGKQGYCIHYATALTEMLRCDGIPARLVEGFCNNYQRRNDEGDYNIIGSDSHAWVEAYLKGIGWIRLEPTNGYGVSVKSDLVGSTVGDDDLLYQDDDSDMEEARIFDDKNNDAEFTDTDSIAATSIHKNVRIYIFAGAVAFMALSLAAGWYIKYSRLQKTRDVDVLFEDILRILGKKYRKKEDTETIAEYFARMDVEAETSEMLKSLRKCMERVWYGSRENGSGILTCADINFIREVRARLKQSGSKG